MAKEHEDLPAPLVPAEVDLTDFQYMELDVRKLRDSSFSARATGEAFRAGVLLWCASWHQVPAGSLPDDDIDLAQLAGYGRVVKEWRKVKAQALHGFVKCSDGRLYHETVCEKALAAWNAKLRHHYDKAIDRLRKANKTRKDKGQPLLPELSFEAWNAVRLSGGTSVDNTEASPVVPQETKTVPPENAGVPPEQAGASAGIPPENSLKGNGAEQNGKGKETLSVGKSPAVPPAPAPISGGTKPPTTADGERLPPEWQLPKAWGEWALAEWPVWTAEKVRAEAEKFRDHWLAKAGPDAVKASWLAAWRKWCRDPLAHRDDPAPGAAPAESDWTQSRRGIEDMGEQLGLGRWDEDASQRARGEHWPAYRERVLKAAGAEARKAA